eukprot:gnl/TRDRNA2_/TRDRNA2_171490_c5_seq2.p1 gnl/TRDRNA2_/TRDRNA2_171490_c5~~gnl/TRDRNA2_/TRDRNA2_171490_c5_seq2.p1  ORF type:complete len:722 (-),score=110.39 gnl/TRDRNA2_/TRDRNA2_171490_c5_seq2:78-2243(-)
MLLQRPEARSGPPCTAKAFKNALIKKYGKLEHAWEGIDTNGDGMLQFHEFVAACRHIQFVGNLRKIFDELKGSEGDALTPEALEPGLLARMSKLSSAKQDKAPDEGAGFVPLGKSSAETLHEVLHAMNHTDDKLGPPCSAKAFKSALIKKYGKLEHAWEDIDTNGDGSLQFHEFVSACRHIQFVGNLRKIFEELKGADFDGLMPHQLDAGLPERIEKIRTRTTVTSSKTEDSDRVGTFDSDRLPSVQTLGEMHTLLNRPEAKLGPPCTAKAFKAALIKKYGKLEHAWLEIDTNGDEALQFHEFVSACRHIQFIGNLRKIFDELKGDNQEDLTPDALCPGLKARLEKLKTTPRNGHDKLEDRSGGFRNTGLGTAETLGEVHMLLQRPDVKAGPPCTAKAFKSHLLKKYGKLEFAWDEIDTNGDGSLQFHEFVAVCRRIQFVGNLRKIFDELKCKDEECLKPEALDPDLPTALEKHRRSIASTWSLHKHHEHESGFQSIGQTACQTMGEVHTKLNRLSARTAPCSTVRGFKNALLKRYEKLEEAWESFDTKGADVLSYQEFVRGCRQIQFDGNLRKIFDQLAPDGRLLPEALDKDLPSRVAKLREVLAQRPRSNERGSITGGSRRRSNERGSITEGGQEVPREAPKRSSMVGFSTERRGRRRSNERRSSRSSSKGSSAAHASRRSSEGDERAQTAGTITSLEDEAGKLKSKYEQELAAYSDYS